MKTLTANTLPTAIAQQLEKIDNKTAKVGVIGLGYVGLPLSLLFSEAGFTVKGFDIDARKVDQLEKGVSYIFRIPSTDIELAREHGFSATTEFRRAYSAGCDHSLRVRRRSPRIANPISALFAIRQQQLLHGWRPDPVGCVSRARPIRVRLKKC